MAFKVRNYAEGDVFVPEREFGNSKLWGQGPREPDLKELGPTMTPVFNGPCYGDVRYQDGARMMDDERPRFKNRLKPADNHLPENA